MFQEIVFDQDGLVPCVVQDHASGEVLTLAYMNEESLRRTIETGEVHFFSRSRSEIWHKGETSGNTQRVRQVRYDCDADAIVALVEPAGPACHTGERSCFYRELGGSADTAKDAPPVPRHLRPLHGRHRITAGHELLRDGEVTVIAHLDAARDPLLHRTAVRMRESGRDVADPRRGDAPNASGPDELIERDIRDRTDELELAPALADQLMGERERDGWFECAPQRDRRAVRNEARNGLREADALVRR